MNGTHSPSFAPAEKDISDTKITIISNILIPMPVDFIKSGCYNDIRENTVQTVKKHTQNKNEFSIING